MKTFWRRFASWCSERRDQFQAFKEKLAVRRSLVEETGHRGRILTKDQLQKRAKLVTENNTVGLLRGVTVDRATMHEVELDFTATKAKIKEVLPAKQWRIMDVANWTAMLVCACGAGTEVFFRSDLSEQIDSLVNVMAQGVLLANETCTMETDSGGVTNILCQNSSVMLSPLSNASDASAAGSDLVSMYVAKLLYLTFVVALLPSIKSKFRHFVADKFIPDEPISAVVQKDSHGEMVRMTTCDTKGIDPEAVLSAEHVFMDDKDTARRLAHEWTDIRELERKVPQIKQSGATWINTEWAFREKTTPKLMSSFIAMKIWQAYDQDVTRAMVLMLLSSVGGVMSQALLDDTGDLPLSRGVEFAWTASTIFAMLMLHGRMRDEVILPVAYLVGDLCYRVYRAMDGLKSSCAEGCRRVGSVALWQDKRAPLLAGADQVWDRGRRVEVGDAAGLELSAMERGESGLSASGMEAKNAEGDASPRTVAAQSLRLVGQPAPQVVTETHYGESGEPEGEPEPVSPNELQNTL